MSRVLAIDPGPERSAWLELVDGQPTHFEIAPNDELPNFLSVYADGPRDAAVLVIEKVQSFGMVVGAEVFETVFWSGRFAEAASNIEVHRIGRKAVVTHLCGSSRAKDTNVRQALIDLFGGKDAAIGRKSAPGPLYGVTADVWSALALAVAYADGVR